LAVCKREFEVSEQLIIIGNEGQGDRDVFWHRRVRKAFGAPLAGGFVGDLFADLG
jgi:hypothetical protein